jgi:TIR domain
MKQLFVSYAREDQARVEHLVEYLRRAGFDVFWDRSMPAGVVWADFLEAQLGSAHRLVVLWTASSVASQWVRTEADEAMQQHKLVPVLLDEVRPPLAFRQIHCFDLIGWQGDGDDSRLGRLAGP